MPSNGHQSCEIFLSVHVGTMGAVAKALKTQIESKFNRSVFLCTELPGGVSYRDEIIAAVKHCKVFIPLMNREWASSGECESEFLLAKRLNLTSHERNISKPPQPRRPVFLPVAFPSLAPWSDHPHVELLAATTNFVRFQVEQVNQCLTNCKPSRSAKLTCIASGKVMAKKDNLLDELLLQTIGQMANDFCNENVDPSAVVATGGHAALMNFSTLRASLDALDVYINQASSVLAAANALSAGAGQKIAPGSKFPLPKPKYIGFTFGRMNEFVETVFSLELSFKTTASDDRNPLPISGVASYKLCSVLTQPGYETKSNAAFIDHLAKTKGDTSAEIEVAGKYLVDHGLLLMDDIEVITDTTDFTKQPGWTRDSYRLLVSPDAKQLTGTLRGWSNAYDIALRADAF